MQRLEVSGAVRRMYGSLDVKGLSTDLTKYNKIFFLYLRYAD